MSLRNLLLAMVLVMSFGGAARSVAAMDEIELLSGTKFSGKLVSETPEAVVFDANGAQMKWDRTKIAALTVNGSRKVINDKPGAGAADPKPAPSDPKPVAKPATPAADKPAVAGNTRTQAEVEALIQKAGQTPPDWLNATALNFPPTLDLTWNMAGRNKFDGTKFAADYFWGTINGNPARWKEGMKVLYHMLNVNKDNPAALKTTENSLGEHFHNLLEDYARAAFFWEKGGALGDDRDHPASLADCYWKLGNKDMAKAVLVKVGDDNTRVGHIIKLWADIGEIDTALQLAEKKAKGNPDAGYLAAGDVCRAAKKYPQALDYYQKVVTGGGRNKVKAQDSIDSIKVYETLDLAKVKDGSYAASSEGYHGQVEVTVVVRAGKIEDVKITKQTELQYYASLTVVPREILEKQGVKGVDAYSSATITSHAIINSAAKALAQGMK